jgi:hypothetical protein
MKYRCSNCAWWASQEVSVGLDDVGLIGVCHRYPPTLTQSGMSKMPKTRLENWCGEFLVWDTTDQDRVYAISDDNPRG